MNMAEADGVIARNAERVKQFAPHVNQYDDHSLEECPECEGYGAIAVRSFSRMDPPESEECSVCGGKGTLTPEQILEYENKTTAYDVDAAYDARFDR